jgi:predicted glycogen debranching enzyme
MTGDPIRFEQDDCTRLSRATKLEWLETNGIGGFSSSTIIGLNTRRYHGLLTAATKPPVGRLLLLSKLEETVVAADRSFELSANQYPGAVHPQGYQYLREFRLSPFPVSTYRLNGFEVEKRVFMVYGENTTVIEYELKSLAGAPAQEYHLELRPLIAFRDYHGATHQNDGLDSTVTENDGIASVTPYHGLPTLHIGHTAAELERSGQWYQNFEYALELERGLDFREDLFNPFVLRFQLEPGIPVVVIASTEPRSATVAPALKQRELERRSHLIDLVPSKEPLLRLLAAAADQFIVQRGEFQSIIAGYPWFSDWGRDTMVALPGLTLAAGRPETARDILLAFAGSVDQGMLPNRFPDAGEAPEFNTVDATLWFFEAIRSYTQYTGDFDFVHEHLYGTLNDILDWHVRGTRYGIRVQDDGLHACGEPGVQLTWMDAKIGDWVVTPRSGKPVEIQALWYNALRIMENFADRFGDTERRAMVSELADRAKESFNSQFWNKPYFCLYDVVDGEFHDGSVRPNQILAVSLAHSMLPDERARDVVETVRRELFIPFGLRTLSPHDPRYRGRYEGGVRERDSAYHMGTVWPWLIGPFLTAYLKTNGRTTAARQKAALWLEGCCEQLYCAGLGQISEITDGDAPHEPRGCFAQAWSVGELLRVAVEDIYQSEPKCSAVAK